MQFSLHIRNVFAQATQANDLALLKAWAHREQGRRFYVWLYYCFPVENARNGGWHCFPGFFVHQISRSFKRYHELGVRGAFFNGFGQDIEAYVSFKLLDDPTQDVDMLLEDYFTGLYGAAAEPMKRLYLRIEEIYSNPANYPTGFEGHQTREIAWKYLGTAERMVELGEVMDAARRAAATDLEKRRVALWEQGVWDHMVRGQQQYAEQEGLAIRTLSVPRASEPAGGDAGKLDWSQAAVLDKWFEGSGAPADRKLRGHIVHDGAHLYLELTEEVDPATLESNEPVWRGDDWEIFVARQRAQPYRQLGVNPVGRHEALAHGEPGGTAWDSGVTVASDTSDRARWTTRLVFPLARLLTGGAKPGKTIYMNFFRMSWPDGPSVNCWSPAFAGPHSPGRMAEVFLEQEGLLRRRQSPPFHAFLKSGAPRTGESCRTQRPLPRAASMGKQTCCRHVVADHLVDQLADGERGVAVVQPAGQLNDVEPDHLLSDEDPAQERERLVPGEASRFGGSCPGDDAPVKHVHIQRQENRVREGVEGGLDVELLVAVLVHHTDREIFIGNQVCFFDGQASNADL